MALEDEPLPVYLVHWNAPEWCASSARSLLQSEGVRVDLTVIDNGQDAGAPLEELLPENVRILRTKENVGYAGGANLALEDWRGRYPESELCLIGSHDLHVQTQALRKLLGTATAESQYGVLGPAILSPFQSSGGYWNGWRGGQFSLDGVRGVVDRNWISGTCMVLRRACVESVGGFDESFGSYVEDLDFCLRAKDAGWKVGVLTDAAVWGLGSTSRNAGPSMLANRAILAAKRGELASAPLRVAVDLGLLGLGTLGASLGAWVFWGDPKSRRESRAASVAHARELRRTISTLGPARKRGKAGFLTSEKDYSEIVVPKLRGDGRTDELESKHPTEPLASIVIITHDGPDSATRAVGSALRQSIRDLEVVVVDDASPEPYHSTQVDERIRVIRLERPLGLAGARNHGLAAARGRWITFVDEKDELVPHMLETSLRAVADSKLQPPVAALSGAEVVDASGRTVEVRVPMTLPRGEFLPPDDSNREVWPTNTLVAPAEMVRAIGGWDNDVARFVPEDLFIRLNSTCSIQGIQELVCRMNLQEHAPTAAGHLGRAVGIDRTLSKHRGIFKANPRARARLEAVMGKSYLKAGRWLPAVEATTRALLHDVRRPGAFRQWVGSLVGPRAWAWYVHLRRSPRDVGR
jgi:GT2 family glycosyltransferase